MRYLLIVFGLFLSIFGNAQSQGVTNAQTKLRPNQLRWSPTDATLDSVYIIRADTSTGEPGWYLVTLSGGGGVQDTTLAGDVVGGLNSTFVRKINGVTVENITPQNREVLTYNGTQWTPDSIAIEDLPQMSASRVLGRGSSSAGAVTQLTPSNGVKISGNYIESDLTAGTGINISGTTTLTVSNSAPDQTVTISGATGTYPNFTVTPTAPGGSSGQVQYNNAGAFGALDSFTVSANPDRVGIGVPSPVARLDIQGSGSTSATNALRVRNSAGTEIMALGNDSQVKITATTTASKSALILSGTGYSGGTATTTKPTLLIEPTGTTSTGWSTSGTKLGVNAESGFTGNLMDLQVNGSSKFLVNKDGSVGMSANLTASTGSITGNTFTTANDYYIGTKLTIRSTVNGNLTLYQHPASGFGLLQLGGTTSSSPAIKRDGAGIDIRLADDSGYGAIQSLYDRFGSGSPESVVTAPVGAVYHRTDGGAGTSFYVKESGTGNTGWIAK